MLIELDDVGHRFPGQESLFTGVSASLHSGDLVAVTGPSGSGKSTLLSILAGWVSPTFGTVRVPAAATTAWVFQNPHGVGQRSALDHVVLPLMAAGRPRAVAEPEAIGLLTEFDLASVASRPYAALSGGEGQRLMLARAVARGPDLMLVDEPTAQLDHTSAASVIAVLHALADKGAIVVIATHDQRVRDGCPTVVDLAAYAETS